MSATQLYATDAQFKKTAGITASHANRNILFGDSHEKAKASTTAGTRTGTGNKARTMLQLQRPQMRVVQHERVLSGMKYIHEEISANLARDNADFAPCVPFVTGGMIFIGQTSQHYMAVRGADIVPHAKGTGGEIDKLFNGDSNRVEAVPYNYEPQF